jgi:hypothetical protein
MRLVNGEWAILIPPSNIHSPLTIAHCPLPKQSGKQGVRTQTETVRFRTLLNTFDSQNPYW